jgi:hypothetical protein
LLGVRHAFGWIGEGLAVVKIRRVDDVTGRAEVIGEGEAARREALGVVEKEHGRHFRAHRRRE